ncbi:MAG: SDR family NAD(P)-dependent oxidoreductase [Myxococcales bacterium]|nr:SDR family NAD(P)-dependent oxidoreductase [Myxococcales bacterium]
MRNLRDRVAVVTGSASGIGRATAVALAERGADLALADVDEVGLRETARLVEAAGRRATTHRVDVSAREAMEAFAADVLESHGRIHVVVNNAGVSVTAPFEDHSLEDFEWLMGVNFWGVVYGCKFFLPHIKAAGEGHIVNISSLFGLIGLPTQSSYAASKFAVRGFSESLRTELRPYGIGVTSVHPGGINTNIVKSSRFTETASGQKAKVIRSFEKTGWPPELVGRRIVEAIERDKARMLVGPETYVTDYAKRLVPELTNRLVDRLRRRMGL